MPKHAPPTKLHTSNTGQRGKGKGQGQASRLGVEQESCPLCVEDMDETDLSFLPCPCGYRVCLFCFQKLKALCSSKCPNCRRIYGTEDAAEPEKPAEPAPAITETSSRPPPPRLAATPSCSPATPGGHYTTAIQNNHNPATASTATSVMRPSPIPPKPPVPPPQRKPEQVASVAVPVSKRPGDMQQQETNQQQLHGLPSGVTWATQGMRQQAVESPAAAVPVAPLPPPPPSLPSNSVVDDNLWPSLSDSTATAVPTGKLKSEQDGNAGGRQGKLGLGMWDRSGSGSGSTLEQMGNDPQMSHDQQLHLQSQYHPLGSSGGGAQPQSRFTGQGQQQAPAPSTSYLPLGQPAGGVLEQFGGPRQHRATNGHVAASPAVSLDPPPSFNVFLNQGQQDGGGGASARLPPPKPPLAPTPPTQEALELAALLKQRANGKAPVPLIAAGKQPPPGFAGPTSSSGGSSNGAGSPRGTGFASGTGVQVQQPLNMTSLVQQQQSVASSTPQLPVFPSRLLGPHISPLNNEDNPVVAGPFVARCRPISPPSASNTAYGSGAYVKPLPSPSSSNPSASLTTLRPQLWSGLPGIDLGPYNNLWQNAYQPTAYRPLIQQQQQQAPPVQQQQQQQHAHYQPLLQMHLQQQQQLLHQSTPQQQSHLAQGSVQASQLGGQGLSQMDPQVSYPMAGGASAKSPPPGFGPAMAAGGLDNGAAKQNGYRPYQLQLQQPARYNPLGVDPSAQPPQQQQQPPQQQIPVHQVPGYRPQLSPA